MIFSFDLLFEAVLFGVLLGCFYAAVSSGLSVSFGLLDVPNVAHPALMIVGSYCTYVLWSYGLDPILAGVVLMPAFFVFGVLIYRFYYESFEKRGTEAGVRGLAFFFGIAFIVEVGLILTFGVDQRSVSAGYIGSSLELGEYRFESAKSAVTAQHPAFFQPAPNQSELIRAFDRYPVSSLSHFWCCLVLFGAVWCSLVLKFVFSLLQSARSSVNGFYSCPFVIHDRIQVHNSPWFLHLCAPACTCEHPRAAKPKNPGWCTNRT